MRKIVSLIALCLAVSTGAHAEEPQSSGGSVYTCHEEGNHVAEADATTGALRAEVSVGSERLRDQGQFRDDCAHATLSYEWWDLAPDTDYLMTARVRSTATPVATMSTRPLPKRVPITPRASVELSYGAAAFTCNDPEPGDPTFCAGAGFGDVMDVCDTQASCDDPGAFEITAGVSSTEDTDYIRVSIHLRANGWTPGFGSAHASGAFVVESVTLTAL